MTKADSEKSFLNSHVKYQVNKRKCLYHPLLECPTPDEPCIFTRQDWPCAMLFHSHGSGELRMVNVKRFVNKSFQKSPCFGVP